MKNKIIQSLKIVSLLCIVIILVFLISKVSYTYGSNSLIEEIRVDEVTSNYISFNYVDKAEHILEIDNPKKISDFLGKRLLNDNSFEFDISFSEKDLVDDKVYYDLVLMDLGNAISEDFVKIYLTDQNNKAIGEYDEGVPLLSSFSGDIDGKVIYTGCFTKDDLNDNLRLRIWISNKYKKDVNNILAYHIKVKVKN